MLDFVGPDVDKRRPMGIQVKICGIAGIEAADAALKAGADFAGLVFHPKSPRYLRAEQASALAARLRGHIRLVALVADAGDEEIAAAIAAAKPDFLQLHGQESPARVASVRARFSVAVIKALAVAEAQDFAGVSAYEDVADMLLFDAKAPQAATRPGGHGAAFDWQLLRGRKFSKAWLLAGGLAPDNVARAIRMTEAPGVDVSSGVETAPGVKSADAIRAFVTAARMAQFATETQA
ncbi:MAG: phosphoribosylanthranilate isomerase [Rhizomicrobium sp.]